MDVLILWVHLTIHMFWNWYMDTLNQQVGVDLNLLTIQGHSLQLLRKMKYIM